MVYWGQKAKVSGWFGVFGGLGVAVNNPSHAGKFGPRLGKRDSTTISRVTIWNFILDPILEFKLLQVVAFASNSMSNDC
jgi:hypothetical protein